MKKTSSNKKAIEVESAELKASGVRAEKFAESFEDSFANNKVENNAINVKITADTAEFKEGIAEVQKGLSGLKAFPIMERKPQMPEKKAELVSMLMGFIRTVTNPDVCVCNEYIEIFPKVAAVLADLVN